MIINRQTTRRRILRGMLGGTAVTVGLPLLNIFLNTNGNAFANGTALPTCFGTFFYGLGLTPGQWEPKIVGPNYEVHSELEALKAFKNKVNVYSGLKCYLDGHSNQVHSTGVQVTVTGGISRGRADTKSSIDTIIADVVGTRTRFRSLEVNSMGRSQSNSRREGGTANPAETAPGALYTRIFGPEFVDPNSANFTPDPQTIARRSALSGITEQRQALITDLGADDRTRLDQYFTSLRELEQQLELALQKPAPMASCSMPDKGEDAPAGTVVEDVMANNALFSRLLAHALACGQTQVFNSVLTDGASNIRKAGSADTHHVLTHEEGSDESGYQSGVSWFNRRNIESLAALIAALDAVREGDRTLLDRSLIYAVTDTGLAKVHSLENMPLITVGSANGRMKTGIHVHAQGDPATRVGLTVQQAMGIASAAWGTESNATSKAISEVLA